MSLSLLGKARKENVKSSPYPYLVVENALDEAYYGALEAEYPPNELIAGTSNMDNNTRYQVSAKNSVILPQIWQDFVAYHTSQNFYEEVMNIFRDHLPERLSWLNSSRVHVRDAGEARGSQDVSIDCQVGINSPVLEDSSVKGPHVDNKIEMYAGLFYMRADDDDSVGGSLEIFEPKDPNMELIHKKEYDSSLLNKVDEVPYSKNSFVIFLCSKHSIHGVQPRGVTPHSRRLVNVIAELSAGTMW